MKRPANQLEWRGARCVLLPVMFLLAGGGITLLIASMPPTKNIRDVVPTGEYRSGR